jgi:transposase
MRRFLEDTMKYLEEYYKRVNSENGFAQDKKMFGDKVRQKREDRIDTVLICRGVWHNILYLFS